MKVPEFFALISGRSRPQKRSGKEGDLMVKRWMLPAITLLCLAVVFAAGAADFPRWRGENSNGSAGDPGMPLVKAWDETRVAWVSELKNPHPWNYSVVRGRSQWPRTVLGNGGYCMPAVHDGKVYVAFWRGAGTVEATDGDGKYKKMWVNSGDPRLTLILADMVIACMDARTGVTVWETVFKEKEMNHAELYGGHNNLCVAGGKVFAFGNAGWLYCVDAQTGEKRWETPIGASTRVWDAYKKKCLEEKLKGDNPGDAFMEEISKEQHPEGGSLLSSTYNMCLVVADGVLIAGEWSRSGQLKGFDIETGQQIWDGVRPAGGVVPPLLWRHKGREYAINAGGTIGCLDPKTGKSLWNAGKLGNTGYDAATAAIDGDLLVAHGDGGDKANRGKAPEEMNGWVCYRMSETGAELKWRLDAAYMGVTYVAPVVHDGYAYLPFRRDRQAKVPENACDISAQGMGLACVEMKTGRVVGELGNVPIEATCPGMVGMGDKLVYLGSKELWLVQLNGTKGMADLGTAPQFVNFCSSPTAADGFVYFRSGERLVTAIDLRSPAARPAPSTAHKAPENARYEFTIDGARSDGKNVRFFMRGRTGRSTRAGPGRWRRTTTIPMSSTPRR